MQHTLLNFIEQKLNAPLPGKPAQYRMAHGIRKHDLPVPENAYIASVLLLLFPKNDTLHTIFIERETGPHDKHSGQMSFPGGRYEADDGSFRNTALREAEEEVGIRQDQVKILGRLSELYIPVSNFLVHPFVGIMNSYPEFQPQPSEVKNIVEVPLDILQKPETKLTKTLKLQNKYTLKDVPYFDVFGNVVWGATAMILNEFLEVIAKK